MGANDPQEGGPSGGLRPTLTAFDTTSLVVGAVVGADIYVVGALGASLIGPAVLVAWMIAGIVAALIALSFAQSAAIVPETGGAYAYARHAFGHFPGFLAGWSLYLAEIFSISIFPVAFTRYLSYFVPGLSGWNTALAKTAFAVFLIITNYVGTRATGRVNDALTIGKMGPLLILIVLGGAFAAVNRSAAVANLTPFAPLGWGGLGAAMILAFWAYAGFELAVLPAGEVFNAQRTLPLAMAVGMGIATAFYLLVNVAVTVAVPYQLVAQSPAPLATALQAILRTLGPALAAAGGVIMAVGGLLSISGADESAMLGTARLSYAMAVEGYFPRAFARLHPRYRTPYLGIIFLGTLALVASLIGSLTGLVKLTVFLLALAYLATVLATIHLTRQAPERRLHYPGSRAVPWLALVAVIYLFTQTEAAVLVLGGVLLVAGVPVYLFFSRGSVAAAVKGGALLAAQRAEAIERALGVAPANLMRDLRALWHRAFF